MLYLPRIITAEQVPEAEALVPLPAAGKKQTGTLIVSVANEVFSLDNARHIEVANQIELRLVDQDLIERYEDMYWST
ncbi:Phage protein [plant metagenome]|uniref:Phage protein n=1 Tax=plant metagenome TaxID=1297885 RepID=A0A484V6B5_9ZZZZ